MEYVLAALIVLVLLGMAGFYGWRQWRTLRGLRGGEEHSAEDRRYYRAQAWRRLVSCGLMVVLAGLLAGWYWLGLDQRIRELHQAGEAARARGELPTAGGELPPFFNQYLLFWAVFVLIVLVLLGLAFWDLWAIRRFGRRHYRQIQADRRAMIEDQAARMRREKEKMKDEG